MVTTRAQARRQAESASMSYVKMVENLVRIKRERSDAGILFMKHERGKVTGFMPFRDRYLAKVAEYNELRDKIRAHPEHVPKLSSPACVALLDELQDTVIRMQLQNSYSDMTRELIPSLEKLCDSPDGLALLRTEGLYGRQIRHYIHSVIKFIQKSRPEVEDKFPYYAGLVTGLCKANEFYTGL